MNPKGVRKHSLLAYLFESLASLSLNYNY